MAEVVRNLEERQEYWKPKAELPQERTVDNGLACAGCGTDYPLGARFCYVCGTEREPAPRMRAQGWWRIFELGEIKAALGLSTGSLIAFVVGVICVIAACAVGFLYTASTMNDWQAVQMWRLEWMVAAIVAFIAGVLLKRA